MQLLRGTSKPIREKNCICDIVREVRPLAGQLMYPMVPLIQGQVFLAANVDKMTFKHPLSLSDKCWREGIHWLPLLENSVLPWPGTFLPSHSSGFLLETHLVQVHIQSTAWFCLSISHSSCHLGASCPHTHMVISLFLLSFLPPTPVTQSALIVPILCSLFSGFLLSALTSKVFGLWFSLSYAFYPL